jgi:hypothetical protein
MQEQIIDSFATVLSTVFSHWFSDIGQNTGQRTVSAKSGKNGPFPRFGQ